MIRKIRSLSSVWVLGIVVCVGGLVALAVAKDREGDAATSGARASKLGYRGTLLVQMRVADLRRSIAFYHDLLDFDVVVHNEDLKWAKVSPGIDGVLIGLGEGPEVTGSGSVSLNIGVKNIESARSMLESRGIHFTGPTMVVPDTVKLAEFSDPDGNRIRLAEALNAK